MTAPTRKPLDVKPLNLVQALDAYAAHLAAMTDAQFAVERARIEATPDGLVHHTVDDEADRRAMVARMASRRRWGWSR